MLYGSDHEAFLYLANLVEGTYLFQLRVMDIQGRSSMATATVEVRPGMILLNRKTVASVFRMQHLFGISYLLRIHYHLEVWGRANFLCFYAHQGCIYLIKNTVKKPVIF